MAHRLLSLTQPRPLSYLLEPSRNHRPRPSTFSPPFPPTTSIAKGPLSPKCSLSDSIETRNHFDETCLKYVWREVQGSKDWEGLMDPMNPHLRKEIVRYGEFAQASYDSFDFDKDSVYCGSCKYSADEFFQRVDMPRSGYQICRYLYATSNISLPGFFQRSGRTSEWSPRANWMGYVAVATDVDEIRRLGRRDIVIAWRGTMTHVEWIHDVEDILRPAEFRAGDPNVMVESGFYDLYTSKDDTCRPCCSFSARQQVLAEVQRLAERFEGEELSITVTGHSLGAALATLTAYDIAEVGLNAVRGQDGTSKKIPVTVFSFASPRVGNLRFKERCDQLGVKVLRIVNVHDKVPTVPGVIVNENFPRQKFLEDKLRFLWSYAHIGTELRLDHTDSPFLKSTVGPSCIHNLEAHLHLVDGYHGKDLGFGLASKRDIALVNKGSGFLRSEFGVPPY